MTPHSRIINFAEDPTWNSRTFDDSGMALPSPFVLSAVQHPLAQLIEAGATIGLSRPGLDRLELAGLAFEGSPGSDKATHGRSSPGISGGFDLTIQELGIAAPLIPSADEICFMWLKA